MKLKEFGPPGGARPLVPPLDAPLVRVSELYASYSFKKNKIKVSFLEELSSFPKKNNFLLRIG